METPEIGGGGPESSQGAVSQDERTLAIVAHLLGLFTNFLGPLIVYLVKKESRFVAFHSMQELVLQLSLAVVAIVLVITVVGSVLLPVLGVGELILVIIASVRASNGEWYEYPVVGKWARQLAGF